VIFPILKGLLSPRLAPLTYFLFILNCIVFLGTADEFEVADQKMEAILNDRSFLETQGLAFSVMVQREPEKFSVLSQKLSTKTLAGDLDSRKVMGSLAIRNLDFMQQAEKYDFAGDEVAVSDWRTKLREFTALQTEHPSYLWGLSSVKSGWMQYITYQFSHNGSTHLFWNMLFLLIFGSFVESALGSSFVILTYLGAGFLGAVVYSKLSGIVSTPMVGASASISGLMALVGFHWLKKEKLRFFYWLLPLEGYFGLVLLPSWLVLLVSLVPDISGYLGASKDFGAVAYAAHLGGAACGGIVALLLKMGWMIQEVESPRLEKNNSITDDENLPKAS
jgi:membrane associated rhomboid family serine protease